MRLQHDLPRIDLRFAKLCMELDCNTVFDSALFRHCPTCGSVEFYPLESWLNRERLPNTASPQKLLDALGGDAASRVERARWLRRLRETRVEGTADLETSPLKLRIRNPRRRAG
jgi:hypothetical protein